jgi:hypothetical protein
MLKSSSLCLYSSNLSTFWLKIEQFWPFEEISIFSHGGHLAKFDLYKHNDQFFNIYYGILYEHWTFAYFDRLCKLEKRGDEIKKKSSPLKPFEEISIFNNGAILEIGRHWRTQFWKGTTQGSFQKSLVEIGSVDSEEKIFFFIPLFSIFI